MISFARFQILGFIVYLCSLESYQTSNVHCITAVFLVYFFYRIRPAQQNNMSVKFVSKKSVQEQRRQFLFTFVSYF